MFFKVKDRFLADRLPPMVAATRFDVWNQAAAQVRHALRPLAGLPPLLRTRGA